MFRLERIASKDNWNKYRQMVLETTFTSFTLLPEWLDGYCLIPGLIKRIGYLIYDEEGVLIGGIAGVTYWLGRRITIFPSDPVIIEEFKIKHNLEPILMELFKSVKGRIHISSSVEEAENIGLKRAKFPKGFYPNPGLGLIESNSSSEVILSQFKYQVRRNIKRSFEQELEIFKVTNILDLDKFYNLLKRNAKENNYSIRPKWMMISLWKRGFSKGSFEFYFAKKEDSEVGCIWVVNCGEVRHNIMGASIKTKPRLEVGYAIQWHMLKECIDNKMLGYNISIGGPSGVEKFKDDFGRNKILIKKSYVGIF